MLRVVQLEHLRVIAVSGPDRVAFLQGQLTQDVTRLADDMTCLGGWADARGRLMWAGHLFTRAAELCLLTPSTAANALAARLKLFVLRARVQLKIPDLRLTGVTGARETDQLPRAPGESQILRLAADPGRALLIGYTAKDITTLARDAAAGTLNEWRLQDIRAGIPEVTPATSGEFVPQMMNLDLLDGISFSKGCYTGQEIVARTRFLGRIKRRMLRFAAAGSPPAPGAPLFGSAGVIGQVVSAATLGENCELLAVTRLAEGAGQCFLDPERTRVLTALPLPYSIPEASQAG